MEEIKIENGDIESVREWCDQIEAKIELADVEISLLRGWMAKSKEKTKERLRKQELELFEVKMYYQKELQAETMIGMQGGQNKQQQGNGGATAKLPNYRSLTLAVHTKTG